MLTLRTAPRGKLAALSKGNFLETLKTPRIQRGPGRSASARCHSVTPQRTGPLQALPGTALLWSHKGELPSGATVTPRL